MMVVTPEKIDQLRDEFDEHEGAELALETLENYGGDIEAAIEEIANQAEIDIWSYLDLEWINQQCRTFICQTVVRRSLPGLADIVTTAIGQFYLPGLLAAALGVLIAVKVESDLEIYCDFEFP